MGDAELRALEREAEGGANAVAALRRLVLLRERLQRFPRYLQAVPYVKGKNGKPTWLAHGVQRGKGGWLRTFCGKGLGRVASSVSFAVVSDEPMCDTCRRSRAWKYLCGQPFPLGELRSKVPLWLRKRYGRQRVGDSLFWVRIQDQPNVTYGSGQLAAGLFPG